MEVGSIFGHFALCRLGWAYLGLCWVSFHSTQPTLWQFDCAMRNPTMPDFRTEHENCKFSALSFLLRSNWPLWQPGWTANRSLRRALRSWAQGLMTQGRTTQPCRISNNEYRISKDGSAVRCLFIIDRIHSFDVRCSTLISFFSDHFSDQTRRSRPARGGAHMNLAQIGTFLHHSIHFVS